MSNNDKAAASQLIDMDFVVHCAIDVDAPRSTVWPYIVDTNSWMEQQLRSAGGTAGKVGERFDVHMPGSDVVLFHLENVELEPGQRRTIRVYATDGTFYGYSSWALRDNTSGGTAVTYDVYCRYPMPAGTDLDSLLADASSRALANLKVIAEGSESTPVRAGATLSGS
jgi:hypothetical protein